MGAAQGLFQSVRSLAVPSRPVVPDVAATGPAPPIGAPHGGSCGQRAARPADTQPTPRQK